MVVSCWFLTSVYPNKGLLSQNICQLNNPLLELASIITSVSPSKTKQIIIAKPRTNYNHPVLCIRDTSHPQVPGMSLFGWMEGEGKRGNSVTPS